ncbi:MAG: CoA transferase [Pseudomonadota bacterium]
MASAPDQAPSAAAPNILSPYRVLDLTRVRSGPTCVRQLADWGADVIKIETPASDDKGSLGGPRAGADFQNLHRNKRSLTLNLKDPRGLEIFKALARDTDIIVENYRPGVKHRLGIDYETLRADNPGLIYASISGFGQDGPFAGRPGFDQIAQGMGGLMSITGAPGEGPMRVGIPIADLSAGIFAAFGILLALIERQRSGEGQWIQSSLLQAQAFMLDFQAARWLMDGNVAKQAGNNHPTSIPTGVYETADGHINIACAGQAIWERFKALLDDRDLDDPRFADPASRSDHRDALNAILNAHTRKRTSADWIATLNEASVPCGEIASIDQVFSSPQMQHLGMARAMQSQERGPTQVVGQPIKMSRSESPVLTPPPTMGEHTDAILKDLGRSAEEIETLRRDGVV